MNKPSILVVEDDPSVRNLITTTLKTNDYHYVVAPNGSAAIMEATSHDPEIILLDLGLPDMPIIALCRLCITPHTAPPLKVWGLVVTSPQSSVSLPFQVEKALFRFSTIQF